MKFMGEYDLEDNSYGECYIEDSANEYTDDYEEEGDLSEIEEMCQEWRIVQKEKNIYGSMKKRSVF